MENPPLPIIQPEELLQLAGNRELVLVNAGGGPEARAAYNKLHLHNAFYIDTNTHLARVGKDPAQGGRHPLPAVQEFAATLGALGITPNSHVVVYDDKNGSNAAARFWWMLRAVGHTKAQVINGGLTAAIKAGFPTDHDIAVPVAGANYPVAQWQLLTAGIEEVESAAGSAGHIIIDVRDQMRYNGEHEPIDLVAGHIPSAINIPFTTNLDDDGYFLSPAQLYAKYSRILGTTPSYDVIVHCGSGVTACHTLLAMAYAGLAIPKLYVGSWSEWSRNGKPVATIKS